MIIKNSLLSQNDYRAEWKFTFLRNKGLENVLSVQVALPNGPDTLITLYSSPIPLIGRQTFQINRT